MMSNQDTRVDRRSKQVIYPVLQRSLTLAILLPIVLGCLLIFSTAMVWMEWVRRAVIASAPDQQVIVAEVLAAYWNHLWLLVGVVLIIVIPLLVFYSIKVSHQIVGPLKALEIHLRERLAGKPTASTKVIQFRSGDETAEWARVQLDKHRSQEVLNPSADDPKYRQ